MLKHRRTDLSRKLAAKNRDIFGPATVSIAPLRSPLLREERPKIGISLGTYRLRLAVNRLDLEAACRLRFRVFNLELGEGLTSSSCAGMDEDQFDRVCDHLIVEDQSSGAVVGTYRMQSGVTAGRNFGYYSEREFDSLPFEPIRREVLELGRASICSEHRSSQTISLLWRGIAQYARLHGLRYLIGCSSLISRNPRKGWGVYRQLQQSKADSRFCTRPVSGFELPQSEDSVRDEEKVPKLLKTYVALGARICGTPAWDREFGTIDFLTMLDLTQLSAAARSRFLPETVHSPVSAEPVCVS